MKIYFLSGLGANEKAFNRLNISKDFEPVFLDWKLPEKSENLDHYAARMAEEINVNEPFILSGLSFGGIVVQEMNKFVQPEKNILISSVKNRSEIPTYMKLSSRTSAHKLIPMSFFTNESVISYAFFRKLYDSKMPSLNDYFQLRDKYYLKWAINKIINWKNQNEVKNVFHLHGNKDIVFPFKNIVNPFEVDGGTHLMVLQKSKKVSEIINEILMKK